MRTTCTRTWIAALAMQLFLPGAHAGTETPLNAYRLGAGDVVEVSVYGHADLSGRFAVSPDGTVSYPLLGNVEAGGFTPAEFGERLDADLAEYVPDPSVSVSVFQYAPVFVVGDVQTPGRYEYRPGMTALELVALGGGMRRAASELENTQLQMIASRQDYADLEIQVFALEATRERVRAELDGTAYGPDPAQAADPNPAWRAVKQGVVAGERQVFDIRKAAIEGQDRAFVAQQQSYDDEIAKVTESMELHKQEIALLVEDVAAQKELASRGLTAKSNLREAERNLSSMRRDALELGSYLARAQQNKLAIEQQRVALATTRRDEAARQLQEIAMNVARMRARQKALLDTMAELALMSGESAMVAEERRPDYTITRRNGPGYEEISGSDQSSLSPGDIVRVALPRPSRPRSLSLN